MRVQNLFPTPLICAEVKEAALCAKLKARILARESESAGVVRSNSGGWQSGADFLDWSGEEGALLVAAVQEVVDQFTGVFGSSGLERVRLQWRVNAWANINRSGAANDLHYHPGAYWSAVFYVDDGGIDGAPTLGGGIEFVDPRGPAPLMAAPSVKMLAPDCATAGLGEIHYPKTGELLVFPAWLGHRVTAYRGVGARISVAMNFAV